MESKGILRNKGAFFAMPLLNVMFIGVVSANSVSFNSISTLSNSFEVGQTINRKISISGNTITGISSFAPPNLIFTSNSPDVINAITSCSKDYSTSSLKT